ncbi:restriction endonuclease subunit S [Providencia rettgeri]|uniref:restriction endonuclease subunit S n=2 Tax=Providencia TaxID=586 RepID=UPI001182BFFB|nr:restriction endonuclease subunit S [Providencia rettgeri]
MVPNGWKEVKLGDVISHQKGFAFKSEHYCDEGKRIIRISDTDRNSIHDKSPVYINDDNSAGLERYALSAGDIILSTVGSRPHLLDSMVGKAVQIPPKDEGALLNQNLVKISPKKKLITNNYLFSMLKKNKFNFFISTLVRGNANQVSITLNELFSYKFLLPTYDEQQKIAQILSTWDKAIATTEKLIATSQQQKKALMQQLLTGKKRLVNPDTGKVFEGNWEEVKLSKVCSRLMEKNNGQSDNVVTISAQHGLIRQEEFFKKSVASETLDNYFILRKGQFAYNKSYSNGYPMGAIKRLNRYEDAIVTSLYICFEIKNHKNTSSCFLEQYFESGLLNRGLTKVAAEGGRAHGLLNVKPADFMALSLHIPVFKEQQKIASVLIAADKEIELLQAKLAHLKDEKKALMQQLLTGKRRVKVDENVAA